MRALSTIIFALLSFASISAAAERAWIGDTPIKEISYVRSNGNCGPDGGPCLRLRFYSGFKGCEWISIGENDHHYKNIQSLALVSLSAGKKFKVYASNEHYNNSSEISINNVLIY